MYETLLHSVEITSWIHSSYVAQRGTSMIYEGVPVEACGSGVLCRTLVFSVVVTSNG